MYWAIFWSQHTRPSEYDKLRSLYSDAAGRSICQGGIIITIISTSIINSIAIIINIMITRQSKHDTLRSLYFDAAGRSIGQVIINISIINIINIINNIISSIIMN